MNRFALFSFALVGSFLAGCSSSFAPVANSISSAASIGQIRGVAHGGQQPIVGMHLYLYAASTSGYGGASTSLLTNVSGKTVSDGTNYYVTTDSNGFFSLSGNYACTSGTQVYLYGIGGNPGAGTNSAASLMAVLGECPNTGTLSQTVPYVWMNEVTTVAAAYALSAYAVDPTHVGTANTVQGLAGIENAFTNSADLVNLNNGQAASTTSFGNGTAPQAEINTLSNILASCVNSTGATSPQCSLLFLAAQSAPTGGTQPTNTAMAALNIAHNPGTNVTVLYNSQPATAAFQPALAAQPNDFTVALQFTGGGLAASPALAVDAAGNVWAGSNSAGALAKFSPFGNALSGAGGYATSAPSGYSPCTVNSLSVQADASIVSISANSCISTVSSIGNPITSTSASFGYSSPSTAALDASNGYHAVLNTGGINIYDIVSNRQGASGVPFAATGTFAVALDGSQNAWVSSSGGRLDEFNSGATMLSGASGITGGGISTPSGVALDHSGNAWVSNAGNNSISEFSAARAAVSGTSGFTGGGLSAPSAIAIDGLGNVWTSNKTNNSLSKFSSSGTAVSPTTGFTSVGGTLASPNTLVIDASGNIWVGNGNATTLTEFVGAAAPVVTPMVTAVTNNTLGTRP